MIDQKVGKQPQGSFFRTIFRVYFIFYWALALTFSFAFMDFSACVFFGISSFQPSQVIDAVNSLLTVSLYY